MALPIMTSEEDVNTIVEYLKTKATGASIEEAKAVIDKKYLDPRKITDYLAWGIVRKDGEKLKLDNLGREMAQKKEPTDIYRKILSNIPAYYTVLALVYEL